jgi:hypothetical protein
MNYIITRDKIGFDNSIISVLNPDELIAIEKK